MNRKGTLFSIVGTDHLHGTGDAFPPYGFILPRTINAVVFLGRGLGEKCLLTHQCTLRKFCSAQSWLKQWGTRGTL